MNNAFDVEIQKYVVAWGSRTFSEEKGSNAYVLNTFQE